MPGGGNVPVNKIVVRRPSCDESARIRPAKTETRRELREDAPCRAAGAV
jgi:hypothetical protein